MRGNRLTCGKMPLTRRDNFHGEWTLAVEMKLALRKGKDNSLLHQLAASVPARKLLESMVWAARISNSGRPGTEARPYGLRQTAHDQIHRFSRIVGDAAKADFIIVIPSSMPGAEGK